MNEFELIEMLTKPASRTSRDLALGVGDDCAIIPCGDRDLLITTDALIEDIHFKLFYFEPLELGQRMLNVNASDIAAMGGTPRFFTACVGLPPGFGTARCRELYDGLYAAAKPFGMELIGGDTTSSDELMVTIAIIGEIARDRAIRRSGAQPGDPLFLTGSVGEAALGLACLERGVAVDRTAPFVERYRLPQPRVAAGQALMRSGLVTSMIDVSDGLLADVGHLASSSKTGYEILVENLPQREEFAPMAAKLGLNAWETMLAGGDDYELAFTVDRARIDQFEKFMAKEASLLGHAITRIGAMTGNAKKRVAVRHDGTAVPVRSAGFDHIRGRQK
jgi:thiamine-monophosphate kinase